MASVPLRETAFDPLVSGAVVVRRLVEASARPGRPVRLEIAPLSVQPRRVQPACAALLAVLDRDARLAVMGPDAAGVREYLRFNSGARSAPPADADFVLVTGPGVPAVVGDAGMPRRAPHRRTIVWVAEAFQEVAGQPTALIVVSATEGMREHLVVSGVDAGELAVVRAENQAQAILDVWFASAEGEIVVLPAATAWFPLPARVPR